MRELRGRPDYAPPAMRADAVGEGLETVDGMTGVPTNGSLRRLLAGRAFAGVGRRGGRTDESAPLISRMEPQPNLRGAALAGIRWTAVSRLGVEVLVLVSSVALARLLAPVEFGRAAIALIVVNLAVVLTIDSFATALVQRPVLDARHRAVTLSLSLSFGTVGAVVAATFALTVAPSLFGQRTADLLLLASPAFLISGLGVVSQADLQRALALQAPVGDRRARARSSQRRRR